MEWPGLVHYEFSGTPDLDFRPIEIIRLYNINSLLLATSIHPNVLSRRLADHTAVSTSN